MKITLTDERTEKTPRNSKFTGGITESSSILNARKRPRCMIRRFDIEGKLAVPVRNRIRAAE